MDQSLARRAVEIAASHEEAAKRMFCDGFLRAGGDPCHLRPDLADEAAIEILTLTAMHAEGPHKRLCVIEQAAYLGRQCAEAASLGEEEAVLQDCGWHISLLRRHGVLVGR